MELAGKVVAVVESAPFRHIGHRQGAAAQQMGRLFQPEREQPGDRGFPDDPPELLAEAADGKSARFGHAAERPLFGEGAVEFPDHSMDFPRGVSGLHGGVFLRVPADQRQELQRVAEYHQPGAGAVLLFFQQNFIEQFGDLEEEPLIEVADFEGARFRRGGVGQSEIGFDLGRALEFGQQLGEEVAGKQDIVDPELSRLRVVVGFAGEDEEDVAGADPVFGAAEAVGGVPFADHHQLIVVVVGVGISHVGLPVMDTVEHLKFEILPVEFGFQEIHGKASAGVRLIRFKIARPDSSVNRTSRHYKKIMEKREKSI